MTTELADLSYRCCFLDTRHRKCFRPAEWEIVHGASPDDVTYACTQHVGKLLTDAKEHRIYRSPSLGTTYMSAA